MKIYLAAMYQWIDKMKVERDLFRAAGFEVTAQWVDNAEENEAKTRHDAAQMDLDDVARANVLVLYTLPKGTAFTSGGRMTEFGYALALGKWVIVVGDRENIFTHLDYVCVVDTTEEAIAVLKDLVGVIQENAKSETMQ